MKAIYQTKYGKSDVLKYGEQIEPVLKASQLLIDNYASSVNPRDWMIRSGRYQLQLLVPSFPLILGSDFAGEVVKIGHKVKKFNIGDLVFGMKNPSEGLSTYAEKVVVTEKNVAHIPKGLSFIEAAGIPLCSLTAWQALVDKSGIQQGMEVLIIGASGGVGSYAVQIARALGANVTAVCSGDNQAMVSELGATNVIDYQQEDFLKTNYCSDIIFDTIGRHSFERCAALLKPNGTYVSTIPKPKNLKAMAFSKIKSYFINSTKKANVVMVKSDGSKLEKVASLISNGMIHPVIDQIFPIQKAGQALDYSRTLRAKGKIILQIK